jgi:hypothetical protein
VPRTRLHWLRVAISGGLAASLLLSPKLWLTARLYPLTPVASYFKPFPPPWDWVVYGALLALLLPIAVVPRPRHFIAGFVLLAFVLALQDQSRLQPWFYQYLLMLLAIGLSNEQNESQALNTCRFITVAVYVWSGFSKVNPAFPHGSFTNGLPLYAAYAIALIESALGIALMTQRFRQPAILTATAMHLFILWKIGPFGMQYNSVVWPWNLAMIAFLFILFHSPGPTSAREILWARRFPFQQVALLLVGLAPVLSFVNLWDFYPSFALYSRNSNSEDIFVSDRTFEQLPETLKEYVYEVSPNLNRLSITDWSYGELNVPSYPERRIFLNAARSICAIAPNFDTKLVTQLKFSMVDSNRSYTDDCFSTALTTSPLTSVNRKSRPWKR